MVLDAIRKAAETKVTTLDLASNQLTSLPPEITQLSSLTSLDLSRNQLTSLPLEVTRLTGLRSLNLSSNRLTSVQPEIAQLTGLEMLDLGSNDLTTLPQEFAQLASLATLDLWGNRLSTLPPALAELTGLETLLLDSNRLTTLMPEIGELTRLATLNLRHNLLTTLPPELAQLTTLRRLDLKDNPLPPELVAAHHSGIESLRAYLGELAKGQGNRYEAKLLILGDGNEGKTCVSRALRGLPFEGQSTTHGVDIEQWLFPHPNEPEDEEKKITLNIWDFEGQEISHQTHQFFLTTKALYLLVFSGRNPFKIERAEYWLDTIKARAPDAKVAFVVTECESRTPSVPTARLEAEYGNVLANQWVFPVGCSNGRGVETLVEFVRQAAASLEFMGSPWPASYVRAERAIRRTTSPYVDRATLNDIFAECAIDEDQFHNVADILATLGIITQFPGCPDLNDFVVLQPQWLTKGISYVLEDNILGQDQGQIAFERMEQRWHNHPEQRYEGMFGRFHSCMKEFELCYDLDTPECLVPLRFGYRKPPIPWTVADGKPRRRIQYRINIHPPFGLMSRLIVKTHHMIAQNDDNVGVYWRNGVFLRTGTGPLLSEALCEFDEFDRTLTIEVRAAFPQNLIEQVHAYAKAVFAFFDGLHPDRFYGCVRFDQNVGEQPCDHLYPEALIAYHLETNDDLGCIRRHKVDPKRLRYGFGSFGETVPFADLLQAIKAEGDFTRQTVRESFDEFDARLAIRMQSLCQWTSENADKLDQLCDQLGSLPAELQQELESKLREYLGNISEMLDNRDFTSAPGILSIATVDGGPWNPKTYFQQKYLVTPYCEFVGKVHRIDDCRIPLEHDRQWWKTTAPVLVRGTKLLAAGLQLAFAGMPLVVGDAIFNEVKNHVTLMQDLTKQLELEGNAEMPEKDKRTSLLLSESRVPDMRDSVLDRVALAKLLEEIAPDNYRARKWGSLERVRMSDNTYRWLCPQHAKESRK